MLKYPEKCYTQFESNIGYYPFRTTHKTVMRYGAHGDAPVKLTLNEGQRIGLQSVRNPGFSPEPAIRGARNGYVWVYALMGGESGWVPVGNTRRDDPHSLPWADGPASMDFEVGMGAPRPKPKPRYTLGWAPKTNPARVVTAENLYIRYSVRGTAFDFLLPGDRVEIRWVHPRGFVCVKVLRSHFCPQGTIGWVWASGLRRPS